MIKRTSKAVWKGDLQSGKGDVALGSGAFEGQYSFTSRFEEGKGTNPEELIAAAHAGCFSMALSADLSKAGYTVEEVKTEAVISMDKVDGGFKILGSKLVTQAKVPGISETEFMKFAEGAKQNCPVSKALGAIDLELDATLVK
ncbi:MAG: OsmC family protein [Anaerolineaceae bacterium]|nr:OsmC family protein [Anaerolineaceae bacterium]